MIWKQFVEREAQEEELNRLRVKAAVGKVEPLVKSWIRSSILGSWELWKQYTLHQRQEEEEWERNMVGTGSLLYPHPSLFSSVLSRKF